MSETLTLFDPTHPVLGPAAHPGRRPLGQYPTPVWVAEALVERYFPDLDSADCVLEPTCGPGAFLQALPAHVPALGIEIDPAVAAMARARTGRRIVEGDALAVKLDVNPTAIVGNPPFQAAFIDGLLERAWQWLPEGGRMGLILPAYYFRPARLARMLRQWSLAQEMIPRQLFGQLSTPLAFALFSKDRQRTLVGFALFTEAYAVHSFERRYRETLETGSGSVWRRVVELAVRTLGGEADLKQIYRVLEGRRPTPNPFWQEKVRQVCQLHLERTAPGRYALPAAA